MENCNIIQYMGMRPFVNKGLTPNEIVVKTALSFFRISASSFNTSCRKREHSDARKIIVTLISKFDKNSTQNTMGKIIGRDRSTVSWCLTDCTALLKSDKQFKNAYDKIHQQVIYQL